MNKSIRFTKSLAALLIGLLPVLSSVDGTTPQALAAPPPQQALSETYVVDTVSDANLTVCDPDPHGKPDCSLRGAINRANGHHGVDKINFGIQSGVQTINVGANLPAITGPVIIDGKTQGAVCNTDPKAINAELKIVLVGNNAPNSIGLELAAGSDISTVQGLVFQKFGTAISVKSTNNKIMGNFIGTNVAGMAAARNVHGIKITADSNIVGGDRLCERNLISGNEIGVIVTYDDNRTIPNDNRITNNLIGTDKLGELSIPNTSYGVQVVHMANTNIEGTAPAFDMGTLISNNVISGNPTGISIEHSNGPNRIEGNRIGVQAKNDRPLPNSVGISLVDANKTSIGGLSPEMPNVIANSFSDNVVVKGKSKRNSIRANSIYGAHKLGIDLGGDGPTANFYKWNGRDDGPNFLQTFPVLTEVTLNRNRTIIKIKGKLTSTANTMFHIDFFASQHCNRALDFYGQGQMYLGSKSGRTVGNDWNNLEFEATLTKALPPELMEFTATATGELNASTSEFSECFKGKVE